MERWVSQGLPLVILTEPNTLWHFSLLPGRRAVYTSLRRGKQGADSKAVRATLAQTLQNKRRGRGELAAQHGRFIVEK